MLEHLTRIYIVCLEAQRNTGCPEEIQGNGQNDEKCNRIRKHKTAQRTDTGLFVVFLAVNDDQGIKGKHGRAYVNSRVTDTKCRLSQFRGNADGHEHRHEDRPKMDHLAEADVMSRFSKATKTMMPKTVT